jgi:hypothetical protein
MSAEPDHRVLEWLGLDDEGTPYYLHPLNLMWSDAGPEHDLAIFRGVADRLATEPDYWRSLLRMLCWRECLAGCTCLLVSGRREFFDDLVFGFRSGCWVAPQIAVTIGILHPRRAVDFFHSALEEDAIRRHAKLGISAFELLLKLGIHPTRQIERQGWSEFDIDDAGVSSQVIEKHWNFWSRHLGPPS